jgi:hypothetical protein
MDELTSNDVTLRIKGLNERKDVNSITLCLWIDVQYR